MFISSKSKIFGSLMDSLIMNLKGLWLALLLLFCHSSLFATAGFAERINEHNYFQNTVAPYFWSIIATMSIIMIFVFKRKSVYWKYAFFYSVALACCCWDYFFELLSLIISVYFMLGLLVIGGILMIITHFFPNEILDYKSLFKGAFLVIIFIIALVLYIEFCELLRYCFPIIDKTFKWVDPDMMM